VFRADPRPSLSEAYVWSDALAYQRPAFRQIRRAPVDKNEDGAGSDRRPMRYPGRELLKHV
jgi:hypothetical protein